MNCKAIAQEIVRGGFLPRVHLGLDYFDASIHRVAAWVIGTRNLLKALLAALLEPIDAWRELERSGDTTLDWHWSKNKSLCRWGLYGMSIVLVAMCLSVEVGWIKCGSMKIA